MDDFTSSTRVWDVTRRSQPASTGLRPARQLLWARFQSLPSMTVAYLMHRGQRARSTSSPGSATGYGYRGDGAKRSALATGASFAGYTVLRPLGAGAMSEVYLAKHPRLPRHDVLKVLAEAMTADPEFRERFNREADLAATLWHPHIVGVHDRGEFDGQLWISMDYVEGTDAARLVKEYYPDGMPLADVCDVVSAVAGALDYAHDRGLLHRDVKPANILLTHPDDEERRILLADFGIARHLGDVSGITATNVAVGTVAYAAPEQLIGSNIDGRADQYALAATAFHLLTGLPPYRHTNPVAVISQHLHADPPRLRDHRPDLAHLDDVFGKALAKDPEDRFDRCRAFTAALAKRAAGAANRNLGARRGSDATAFGRSRAWSTTVARHFSPTVRTAMTLVCAVLVTVAATWSVMHFLHDKKRAAKHRVTASRSTSPVGSPVLNGTYRLDFDRANRTNNGVGVRHQAAQTTWWAFRSSCAAGECVATGTRLDDANHQAAYTTGGGQTDVLRFTDGYWQDTPQQVLVGCRPPNQQANQQASATETEMVGWSLAPQADGTLRGTQSETVRSDECGAQGAVLRIPVVATRIGDVPPSVAVRDPATLAGTQPAPPAPPSAPVLGAPCGDVDKLAYDLTTHEQVVCEGRSWDKAPITTGVHATGTSCNKPDIPVFATSASADGYLIECDPDTRVWTRHAV